MTAPQPLKLMFICGSSGLGFGGAEKNFLRTCQAFHRLGPEKAQVIPVVRRNTWLDGALTEEKIPHHTARFGGLLDFTTKPFLKRLINLEKPHLVQTWMNRATSMTPKVKGVPLVARLGGYYDLKYYKHADHLVGNTQGIVSYLRQGGWAADDTTLVQNFANLPAEGFADVRDEVRRHWKLAPDTVLLFASGRVHPHKGQSTVLRALTLLPKNVHYMMLGGPDEPAQRALAAELGLLDRVHFAGWVNNFSPLCAAADIFVVSSLVEPFGNVILDAWAHGLPLVTSDAAGPLEIVDNGTNGLVYPMGDHEALAAKIKLLLAEPSLAQGLGAAGYQHVRTHYAENVIIAQYLALYHRLLAAQGTKK